MEHRRRAPLDPVSWFGAALETPPPLCHKAPVATPLTAPQVERQIMRTFFVHIKCELGKAYQVASALADAEIASEIYSTAGDYDLMAKFYVDDEEDIGHFVNEKIQLIPGIKDTFTTVTFRAF